MGSRSYIAKIEPDGSGRYIYVGHASYPTQTGLTLLREYQDAAKVDALLDLGSASYIGPEPDPELAHYLNDDRCWDNCSSTPFQGGTGAFFLAPWMPGPEWLYCWTPDGWLAAQVETASIPRDFFGHLSSMDPGEFQDWFDNNQQPEWVAWRELAARKQEPVPLARVIEEYAGTPNAAQPLPARTQNQG